MAARAYLDETGLHIPEYADILADLQAEYRGIYGPDVYLEPDSQDGALLAVFALRLLDCYQVAASVYRSFAPSTAQGAGLDAVVKVNGIRRQPFGYSQADLLLTGQAASRAEAWIETSVYRGINSTLVCVAQCPAGALS